MAITVVDLTNLNKPMDREDTGVTAGNEIIYLVRQDSQIVIQGTGTGDADLKTTLAKYGEVTADADFSKFSTEINKTAAFISKTVGEGGITAVGLDITSGTWTVRISQVRNLRVVTSNAQCNRHYPFYIFFHSE